jgi:hypothetical protein
MADKKPSREPEEIRKASFDLKTTTIKKLKYVSAVDDRFQNEILEEVLAEYFTKWEKANHKIQIKP